VLLSQGDIPADAPRFAQQERNLVRQGRAGEQMVADALAAIKAGSSIELAYPCATSTARSVRGCRAKSPRRTAARAAGRHHPHPAHRFAGQSLGVWNHKGLTITLEGDANDYVGKGMGGGRW